MTRSVKNSSQDGPLATLHIAVPHSKRAEKAIGQLGRRLGQPRDFFQCDATPQGQYVQFNLPQDKAPRCVADKHLPLHIRNAVRHAYAAAPQVVAKRPNNSQAARLKDLFVRAFMTVSWRNYRESDLSEAFDAEINAGENREWLLCKSRSQLLGFCTYATYENAVPPYAYVAQGAVDPAFQGCGIASRLAAALMSRLPDNYDVHAIARNNNDPIQAFAANLGALVGSNYMHPGYSAKDYKGISFTAGPKH